MCACRENPHRVKFTFSNNMKQTDHGTSKFFSLRSILWFKGCFHVWNNKTLNYLNCMYFLFYFWFGNVLDGKTLEAYYETGIPAHVIFGGSTTTIVVVPALSQKELFVLHISHCPWTVIGYGRVGVTFLGWYLRIGSH